jgi:hypothetical protein
MQYEGGEADFREAGFERLEESRILFKSGMFCGSVYLAGRAVENMLRAVVWKHDSEIRTGKKALETGHDLKKLVARIGNLGVIRNETQQKELDVDVQRVARLWLNNMRFMPTIRMKAIWWSLGGYNRRLSLKQAVLDYYNTCSAIVRRCESLCEE